MKEVNFSWELAQQRVRQWRYEKGHQNFSITLLIRQNASRNPTKPALRLPSVCSACTEKG